MRSHVRLLAFAAVFSLAFAACSDDGNDTPADTGGSATGATVTGATASGATGATGSTGATSATGSTSAAATVIVSDSELGEIVTDPDGNTLYVFLADKKGTSTCYDDCADAWPALTVEDAPAGDGVDASLLGTTERDDGTLQVTLGDHPLYFFASDEAPGDTNGQGVGDVWFVVSPDGEPIQG